MPMASNLIIPQTFSSPNSLHKPTNLSVFPVQLLNSAAFSMRGTHHVLTLRKHLPRASTSEGTPVELFEGLKFVPLNADDPRYGPPALLLLGFEHKEAVKIRELLKDMDGEFLEVIYCTEEMISRPLSEVMNTRQTNLEAVKVAESLPKICFLSGLSGEEMTMFIDAFSETGLEAAVFAAMVPNSAGKPLRELIEEIMGDHEMLSAKQSSSA